MPTITHPGSYVEYDYNARNWVYFVRNRNTSGSIKYEVKYYWDDVGNVNKKAEWFEGVANYYWTYFSLDGVYRLTREARKHRDATSYEYDYRYAYDAVGNRTTEQDLVASWTRYYTHDDNNKLTKIGTTSGGNDLATFGYDSNGNMTSVSGTLFGSKTMVYNDDNRMTSITYGGTTDYYYYQYTGQRYRARLVGTYYRYLYDGERVLEELNDSGTMQARYTTENGSYYGTLLHLYRSSGTLSRFPMYDGIGSVRGLLDASATITDSYHLDAWGEQLGSSGSTPNPYKFGGAWGYITDPSGMLQLGQRFYWPELGRFVSQDPIRHGNNAYAYADNNPVVTVDPTGEHWYDPFHWFHRKPKPKPKPKVVCIPPTTKPCERWRFLTNHPGLLDSDIQNSCGACCEQHARRCHRRAKSNLARQVCNTKLANCHQRCEEGGNPNIGW